ncbi:hypothetical protein [Phenylobacterium sp.]|uniref:hypothetical protein n=1 Tax=Phenylobacterium sp. TaxID=1871053 RepID=UPI0035AEC5DB
MRASHLIASVSALAGALVVCTAANAAEISPLGHSVAATATSAETTADKPMAVRVAVRGAVKQLLVTTGPKPDEVVKAIDAVFKACKPADGSPKAEGWSCPAKEDTYSALLDVRGVIVALLESPEPAETGTGTAAISSFPVTTSGGSYYTNLDN